MYCQHELRASFLLAGESAYLRSTRIRRHPSPNVGPAGLVVFISRGQWFLVECELGWLVDGLGGQSKVNRMCQVKSVDLIRRKTRRPCTAKRTKNRKLEWKEGVKKAMKSLQMERVDWSELAVASRVWSGVGWEEGKVWSPQVVEIELKLKSLRDGPARVLYVGAAGAKEADTCTPTPKSTHHRAGARQAQAKQASLTHSRLFICLVSNSACLCDISDDPRCLPWKSRDIYFSAFWTLKRCVWW